MRPAVGYGAAFALAFVVAASAGGAVGPYAGQALPRQFGATPPQPDVGSQSEEDLLGWLVSSDRPQRAEAQVRLLPLGRSLLPRLEGLASRRRDDEARAGLLEFLKILTSARVHPAELRPYRELAPLAEAPVARGLELVTHFQAENTAPGLVDELPGGPFDPEPSEPEPRLLIEGQDLLRLRDRLAEIGGLALPGLERLLSSPSAIARLQGIVLVGALRLRPDVTTLEVLQWDAREVELDARYAPSAFLRPSEEPARCAVTVYKRAGFLAQHLDRPFRGQRKDSDRAALRAEDALFEWFQAVQRPGRSDFPYQDPPELGDLLNSLRKTGAWEASDEQEYWNHARLVWRVWWRVVGPRPEDYDRGTWWELMEGLRRAAPQGPARGQ